jgi:hypothetical protein
MRLLPPLLLFGFFCVFTASSQSQVVGTSGADTGGGVNLFLWGPGSPSPTVGGLDATALDTPTSGWTCTEVVIRTIDDSTNQTLDTYTATNPGATVSHSFTGYASKLYVRVTGDATFQNGANLDFKDLEAYVTTK